MEVVICTPNIHKDTAFCGKPITRQFFSEKRTPELEHNEEILQLVSYTIIVAPSGLILSYDRAGAEERLHNCKSIGVGGHVNKNYIVDSLRELHEELGVSLFERDLTFLGEFYRPDNPVSRVHLGLLSLVYLSESDLAVVEQRNGEIKNFDWVDPKEVDLDLYETWSSWILEAGILEPYLEDLH